MCQELFDTIRNHKTEDGRLLCESFIRAPKRRYSKTKTPVLHLVKSHFVVIILHFTLHILYTSLGFVVECVIYSSDFIY